MLHTRIYLPEQYDWVTNVPKLFFEAEVNITDTEPIIVTTPSYFTNLTTLYASTNTRYEVSMV